MKGHEGGEWAAPVARPGGALAYLPQAPLACPLVRLLGEGGEHPFLPLGIKMKQPWFGTMARV